MPDTGEEVRKEAAWELLPLAEVGLRLYAAFDVVGQRGEEVYSREAFHVVNREHIVRHGAMAVLILVDEANGAGRRTHAQHHLIESVGHCHAVASDGAVLGVNHRAADDIDLAVFLSPAAARHLEVVPVAAVEIVALRTHIGEEEAVLLSLSVPLVVARRTHMPAVVARAHIVAVCGSRKRHVLVFAEAHSLALMRSRGMSCSEVPGSPVWQAVVRVVAGGIARSAQYLPLLSFHCWYLESLYG